MFGDLIDIGAGAVSYGGAKTWAPQFLCCRLDWPPKPKSDFCKFSRTRPCRVSRKGVVQKGSSHCWANHFSQQTRGPQPGIDPVWRKRKKESSHFAAACPARAQNYNFLRNNNNSRSPCGPHPRSGIWPNSDLSSAPLVPAAREFAGRAAQSLTGVAARGCWGGVSPLQRCRTMVLGPTRRAGRQASGIATRKKGPIAGFRAPQTWTRRISTVLPENSGGLQTGPAYLGGECLRDPIRAKSRRLRPSSRNR